MQPQLFRYCSPPKATPCDAQKVSTHRITWFWWITDGLDQQETAALQCFAKCVLHLVNFARTAISCCCNSTSWCSIGFGIPCHVMILPRLQYSVTCLRSIAPLTAGAGWGYFILNLFLVLAVADATVAALAAAFTMRSHHWRTAGKRSSSDDTTMHACPLQSFCICTIRRIMTLMRFSVADALRSCTCRNRLPAGA